MVFSRTALIFEKALEAFEAQSNFYSRLDGNYYRKAIENYQRAAVILFNALTMQQIFTDKSL